MDRAPVEGSSQEKLIDGFGPRRLAFDRESNAIEILDFDKALVGTPGFATQLGVRVARLAGARHTFYARVRQLDRRSIDSLQLVSDHVAGWRLSEVLATAAREEIKLDISAVLGLLRQLIPAIALFARHQKDLAIGTIGPERMILTPQGRLVVAEYVLGPAVEKLEFSREQLWRDLRVAVPASAGVSRITPRCDVAGIGVVTLSLLLGRLLTDKEYPSALPALVSDIKESSGGSLRPISDGLGNWLKRTLNLDGRTGFQSPQEAQVAFEEVLARERGYVTTAAILEMFVARFQSIAGPPAVPLVPPPPPKPEPVAEAIAPRIAAPSVAQPKVKDPEPEEPKVKDPEPEEAEPEETEFDETEFDETEFDETKFEEAESEWSPQPAYRPEPEHREREPEPQPASRPEAERKPEFRHEPERKPEPEYRPEPPRFVRLPASAPTVHQQAATQPERRVEPKPEVEPPRVEVPPRREPKPSPVYIAPPPREERPMFGEPVAPEPALSPEPAASRWMMGALAGLALLVVIEAIVIGWLWNRDPGSSLSGEGELVVQSRPVAARVTIDGEERGATPLTVRLSAGPHILEVRAGRSEPRVIPLEIRAGVQTAQYVELLSVPTSGGLEVRSDPRRARVTIDGQYRGETPLTIKDLPPGEHEVVLRLGERVVTQKVRVEPGVTAQLVVPLR